MQPRKVVEDFKCEVCGEEVKGDGYTDHCPRCLWGKHVDEEIPGDRASNCRGLMEPERVIYIKGGFKIYYKCIECGRRYEVREGKEDDREKLMAIG